IQRPVSRGNVSPRSFKPNPDWGIAWGTGRTNIPSLNNNKYQATLRSKAKRPILVSSTHNAAADPFQGRDRGPGFRPPRRRAREQHSAALARHAANDAAREADKWWSQTGSNRRPPEC